MTLGNLSRLSDAISRSISPENFTGEKGGGMATDGTGAHHARGLGQGWKISPFVESSPARNRLGRHRGAGRDPADLDDAGPWTLAPLILRIYWDGQEHPSVEARSATSSQKRPHHAGKSRSRPARHRLLPDQLRADRRSRDAAYFHAQFRRTNPLPYKEVYTSSTA